MPRHLRDDPRSSSGDAFRTVSIAASGTALVMAVFSAFVVNVSLAWGLSGMSLGLANPH